MLSLAGQPLPSSILRKKQHKPWRTVSQLCHLLFKDKDADLREMNLLKAEQLVHSSAEI